MPEEITEAELIALANSPKTVVSDGLSVSERDIREQIEADKYAANKAADPFRALRKNVLKPPGGG